MRTDDDDITDEDSDNDETKMTAIMIIAMEELLGSTYSPLTIYVIVSG